MAVMARAATVTLSVQLLSSGEVVLEVILMLGNTATVVHIFVTKTQMHLVEFVDTQAMRQPH